MRSGDGEGAAGRGQVAAHASAAAQDAALVERLRREEPGAAEALVSTYGNRVYRLAIRITGNGSDAEEVVQDVLWAAIRRIDSFRGTAAFSSWMYRITANAAYQKRRGRRAERAEVPWDDVAAWSREAGGNGQVNPDWSPRLRDPAVQAELSSVLQAAIDDLPDSYRVAFLLRDVDGLSNSEIAHAVQAKLAAVKSRVHRARLFLRGRLGDYLGRAAASTRSARGLATGGGPPRASARRAMASRLPVDSERRGMVMCMALARNGSIAEAPRSA